MLVLICHLFVSLSFNVSALLRKSVTVLKSSGFSLFTSINQCLCEMFTMIMSLCLLHYSEKDFFCLTFLLLILFCRLLWTSSKKCKIFKLHSRKLIFVFCSPQCCLFTFTYASIWNLRVSFSRYRILGLIQHKHWELHIYKSG